MYYKFWFILTLLCFPGGMVAWFVKKDNVLSGFILGLATAFLGLLGAGSLYTCLQNPLHHLLTSIFCFVSAGAMIFTVLTKKSNRIIAGVMCILGAVFYAVFIVLQNG